MALQTSLRSVARDRTCAGFFVQCLGSCTRGFPYRAESPQRATLAFKRALQIRSTDFKKIRHALTEASTECCCSPKPRCVIAGPKSQGAQAWMVQLEDGIPHQSLQAVAMENYCKHIIRSRPQGFRGRLDAFLPVSPSSCCGASAAFFGRGVPLALALALAFGVGSGSTGGVFSSSSFGAFTGFKVVLKSMAWSRHQTRIRACEASCLRSLPWST